MTIGASCLLLVSLFIYKYIYSTHDAKLLLYSWSFPPQFYVNELDIFIPAFSFQASLGSPSFCLICFLLLLFFIPRQNFNTRKGAAAGVCQIVSVTRAPSGVLQASRVIQSSPPIRETAEDSQVPCEQFKNKSTSGTFYFSFFLTFRRKKEKRKTYLQYSLRPVGGGAMSWLVCGWENIQSGPQGSSVYCLKVQNNWDDNFIHFKCVFFGCRLADQRSPPPLPQVFVATSEETIGKK